jgi:hypothetical protein
MTEPVLDWGSAEVSDSLLRVSLDGEIPSGWKARFETTATLLAGHSQWGAISVSKKRGIISVRDVAEGSEERLRACLEGAVEQANADHPTEEPDEDDDVSTEDAVEDDKPGPDAEMTERFRSFAD